MSSTAPATAALLLALTACSGPSSPSPEAAPGKAVGTPVVERLGHFPRHPAPPVRTLPAGTKVRGWPTTSRNRPGVYSWDDRSCAGNSCVMGFIHNGYGTGHVRLTIERLDGAP